MEVGCAGAYAWNYWVTPETFAEMRTAKKTLEREAGPPQNSFRHEAHVWVRVLTAENHMAQPAMRVRVARVDIVP